MTDYAGSAPSTTQGGTMGNSISINKLAIGCSHTTGKDTDTTSRFIVKSQSGNVSGSVNPFELVNSSGTVVRYFTPTGQSNIPKFMGTMSAVDVNGKFPYASSSTAYTPLATLLFPGTSVVRTVQTVSVQIQTDTTGTTDAYKVRLYDPTAIQEIAGKSSTTGNTGLTVDTLSFTAGADGAVLTYTLPSTSRVWELQVKPVTDGRNISLRSYSIVYDG